MDLGVLNMKKYYHATDYNNLGNILVNGIHPGPDGLVYMCETETDALKFLYVRGYRELLVCEIKILKKDEINVMETFDHSFNFFKCRAFGYKGHIDTSKITNYVKYDL